jgi:DNA polymerase-3 subunit alpha
VAALYNPLHVHTTFSLLDGLSQPWQVAARARAVGAAACAITDHGSVAGVPSFLKATAAACKHCGFQPNQHADGGKGPCSLRGVACPGYEKAPLKPVLGMEAYLCKDDPTVREPSNRSLTHLCVLAKNLEGWRGLVRASSASNRPEHFYHKPRLNLEKLAAFANNNWVAFSGHPGSDLANACFADWRGAYGARTYEEARSFAKPWPQLKRELVELAGRYRELFGDGNFFLEVPLIDADNCPAAAVVTKCMRWLSGATGIPLLAAPDAHYPASEDAADQRILLCSALNTTLAEAGRKMAAGEDVGLSSFFRSNRYHIPTFPEMVAAGHEPAELANTLRVAEMCEAYDIFNKPMLPQFECPGGVPAEEFLRRLCREGWQRKVHDKVPADRHAEYAARLEHELGVLCPAGLAPYFLIVWDLCRYAQQELGCPKSEGRGCLAPGSKVVLFDGRVKPIEEVKIGDVVISSDGRAHGVLDTMTYDTDEELVTIVPYYGSTLGVSMTADHRVLVERHRKTRKNGADVTARPVGRLEWARADSISPGDWLFLPEPKVDVVPVSDVDLGELCDDNLLVLDGDCVNQLKQGKYKAFDRNKLSPRTFSFGDGWAYALGYFAGNGWMTSDKDYLMGFSMAGDSGQYEKLRSIIQPVFGDIHRDDSSLCNASNLVVNSRFAYLLFKNWFSDYRCSADTKHVPRSIMTAPKSLVRAFLTGYLAADGHRQGQGGVVCKSVSPRLIQEVRFLCWRLGVPATYTQHEPADQRPGFEACKTIHQLYIPPDHEIVGGEPSVKLQRYVRVDGGVMIRVAKVGRTTNPTRKVHDLSVDGVHDYVSDTFVVHNSGAGSLAGYVLDIHNTDPVKYGLLWERFYNEGRNDIASGRVSLPDYDMDFPMSKRELLIEYARRKYGESKVSQMVTFGRMQGRTALTDVLRAHSWGSFEEVKKVTRHVPDESAIADELQEMREETGEASIIRWALEHNADALKDYCTQGEDGELSGPLARYFEQAIRLEGTKRSQGKHAAGVIVSPVDLADVCPMVHDRSTDRPIAGLEMGDLESLGLVKLDFLGVLVYDRIGGACRTARTGKVGMA